MNKFCFCFLLFTTKMMVGQNHSPLVFGYQFSVVYQVGTHQKSIGMRINAFCQANFFQVNSSSSLTFFPKSYGGRRNLIQNKNELGAVCFFGSKNQFVSNQLYVCNSNRENLFYLLRLWLFKIGKWPIYVD